MKVTVLPIVFAALERIDKEPGKDSVEIIDPKEKREYPDHIATK